MTAYFRFSKRGDPESKEILTKIKFNKNAEGDILYEKSRSDRPHIIERG